MMTEGNDLNAEIRAAQRHLADLLRKRFKAGLKRLGDGALELDQYVDLASRIRADKTDAGLRLGMDGQDYLAEITSLAETCTKQGVTAERCASMREYAQLCLDAVERFEEVDRG